MLLPPRTSEDHEVRQQQVIAIINYLEVANTKLIGRGSRGGRAFTGHIGEEIFEGSNFEGRLLLQDMTKSEEFIASDM